MNLTQKCQYALRATFELAKHYGQPPVSVAAIAQAQAIPARFLEVILRELRQGRFIASQRGRAGGHRLLVAPEALTVGAIIRFVDGPLDPVHCLGAQGAACPLTGRCAFEPLWQRAHDALAALYDTTTFQQLIEEEQAQTNASAGYARPGP